MQVDLNNCGPMTLDLLLKIKNEQDSTLTLRYTPSPLGTRTEPLRSLLRCSISVETYRTALYHSLVYLTLSTHLSTSLSFPSSLSSSLYPYRLPPHQPLQALLSRGYLRLVRYEHQRQVSLPTCCIASSADGLISETPSRVSTRLRMMASQ